MKRVALPLSIAVVLAYWLWSIGWRLLSPGGVVTPPDVTSLAVFVCVKTAVAFGIIAFLLRANAERLADLGCRPRDLRGALPRGAALAVALFGVMFVAYIVLASFGVGRGTAPSVADMFRDPRDAPLWVFCAVVGAGSPRSWSGRSSSPGPSGRPAGAG